MSPTKKEDLSPSSRTELLRSKMHPPPEQWRHVPTSLNPADEGSRGTDIHVLKTKCRWLFGPKFLLQPEDQWPVQEIGKIPDDDKEVEVEKHVTFIMRKSGLDLLLRRYSSWLKTADARGMVNVFHGLHC